MALPQPVPERTRHPFLTYDMIQEIPDALEATLENTRDEAKRIAAEAEDVDAITFIGSGTAFFAAQLGSQLLRLAEDPIRYQALEAFEFLHYLRRVPPKTLVVGISHSGVTKATVDALGKAQGRDVLRVGITHFRDRPIAQVVNHLVIAGNGPDRSKCHTKCYVTGALASTNVILELLRVWSGRLPDAARDVAEQISDLPALARRVLREADRACARWAEAYVDQDHHYFAGAGPNRVTALEAALKIKETSFLPAEGMETEEVGHGPWVSLDPKSLLVLIAPRGASHERSLDLARVAKIVGTPVLGVVSEGDEALAAHCDQVIEIPQTDEWLSPFLTILPLYLFAYYSSIGRGVNPDELRYLEPRYWQARQIVFPPETH